MLHTELVFRPPTLTQHLNTPLYLLNKPQILFAIYTVTPLYVVFPTPSIFELELNLLT